MEPNHVMPIAPLDSTFAFLSPCVIPLTQLTKSNLVVKQVYFWTLNFTKTQINEFVFS